MIPMRAIMVRAVELDDQEQGFYRGLPLLEILLGLGKLLDIVRGVLEGDERPTLWWNDWARRPLGGSSLQRHIIWV